MSLYRISLASVSLLPFRLLLDVLQIISVCFLVFHFQGSKADYTCSCFSLTFPFAFGCASNYPCMVGNSIAPTSLILVYESLCWITLAPIFLLPFRPLLILHFFCHYLIIHFLSDFEKLLTQQDSRAGARAGVQNLGNRARSGGPQRKVRVMRGDVAADRL